MRMRLGRLRDRRKSRPDVFLCTVRREPDGARSAPNKEIALPSRFDPFPFQEYGFRAALAGHDADRFALNHLHLWINASTRTITKPVTDDLREVKHELVIAFELVVLDTD